MISSSTLTNLGLGLLLSTSLSSVIASPATYANAPSNYFFCFYNVVDTPENKILCTAACDALKTALDAAALLETDSTQQCQAYSDAYPTLKDCLNCRETYGDEVTSYTKETLYALYEPCEFERFTLCSYEVAPGFTASAPASTYLSGYSTSSSVASAAAASSTTSTVVTTSIAQVTSSVISNSTNCTTTASSPAQVNEARGVSPVQALMAAAVAIPAALLL
ncbi:uncharacterized protein SAPINGB_P004249 [Magnusiomyces paraingens]|uniref:Uncharacterized protein n=1 Tax=Magnusiomyces paraingens TaxID=2606893 RepID=A0A5E8BTH5_9ASCO|nr:uncharacterized protein SAPINGB_P004249 [Saprochaete ingens]VVT54763.1 unnamed protein product [Saprochaete ingens]